MKDSITKITILTIILLTILGVIGFSYAYFSTDINGEGKYITLDTAGLKLRYTDDVTMSLNNAIPGDKIERTFTVENIGTKTVSYNIVWKDLINTINNYDLHLDMKCKSYKNYGKSNQEEYGTCDSFYKAVPTTKTSISKDIRRDIEIEVGVTQVYDVTITFLNRPYDQSENLNKSFNGKIDLEEYIDPSPEPIYCTYDGELVQGAEYVNGQYTYRYKQEGKYMGPDSEIGWINIGTDGWGVQLTDKDSTDPVTSKLCTYINDKPVVSMSHMFSYSKATSIDLISFNTSNVNSMSNMFNSSYFVKIDLKSFNTKNVKIMAGMFMLSKATDIYGLNNFNTKSVIALNDFLNNTILENFDISNFDTSNVTNMSYMFAYNKAKNIDISNFNTVNVTDMSGMFWNSSVSFIDLYSFDTLNVTNMSYMFKEAKFSKINISNLDTSKVLSMANMFDGVSINTLNLSNFDTSNVKSMSSMFINCTSKNLIQNFDTSNVTNMGSMFYGSNFTILNLNNFDTSNVTNMDNMFAFSNSNSINLNSFDTENVTSMKYMFAYNKANELDLSNFDISNVTEMTGMFLNSKVTIGYARNEVDAARYNDSSVTKIPSTLKFVVK
ncbi:MAG: BspA family leucine-rich repeat surface protein [Tenericutes bacterium]|nr:BspA family leucine-rich repeat surface protein [Mycoplasmatota bacterium]